MIDSSKTIEFDQIDQPDLNRSFSFCIRYLEESNLRTDLQILTQKFVAIPNFRQTQIMIDNK